MMNRFLKKSLLLGVITLSSLSFTSCKSSVVENAELKSSKTLAGSIVKFKNVESKKCLENWDYGGWNGKKIIQNACKTNKTQKWQLHYNDIEGGMYVIRPEAGSDTVIDVTHEALVDGVQLWKYNEGNRNQLWAIVASGVDKFVIRSVALPKKCLGFSRGQVNDLTQLELLDCTLSKQQLWMIEK